MHCENARPIAIARDAVETKTMYLLQNGVSTSDPPCPCPCLALPPCRRRSSPCRSDVLLKEPREVSTPPRRRKPGSSSWACRASWAFRRRLLPSSPWRWPWTSCAHEVSLSPGREQGEDDALGFLRGGLFVGQSGVVGVVFGVDRLFGLGSAVQIIGKAQHLDDVAAEKSDRAPLLRVAVGLARVLAPVHTVSPVEPSPKL